MAESNAPFSVECDFISIPSSFLTPGKFFDLIEDESLICGIGPNTLLVSETTARRLNIDLKNSCQVLWLVLKLGLSNLGSCTNFKTDHALETKRLLQVVIDTRVKDDLVITSEEFFYNLEYCLSLRTSCRFTSVMKLKTLQLSLERRLKNLPTKATKVVLSLIQLEPSTNNDFVDKALQSYFTLPRYVCKNDTFGVYIPKHHKLDTNNINIDVLYFKVCQIEGSADDQSDICQGFFVDSSVTIYQVPNNQDLHPPRRLVVDCSSHQTLDELINSELLNIFSLQGHNLTPHCLNDTFQVVCSWVEPFLSQYHHLQDAELTPIFLLSGPNGCGKTMLLEAVSRYFGINYWRIDCVMVGESVPGQTEAKLKAIFSKLSTIAPVILHLSNIQALFEDAEGKDDIRVLACFEHHIKSLKPKYPVIIIASTGNIKSISSNINQLFLETTTIKSLNQSDREEVLSWFVNCYQRVLDKQIEQAVASQTSGFLLRDLEMLVSLASKEKYCRLKQEQTDDGEFVLSDFSKTSGTMRKVFSESIGAPKVPSVSWKDVGGLEHLKKEILRSFRSNLFTTGLRRSGLLLHGPPGTGKTLLAKAVATQCGRNFLSVKGPELLNMYVGQSEQNVRDLFELAKAASPCIVFFDELDSLAPNRGRSGDSGGVMDRVVSQLLAEMDGVSSSGDVFILGATNRPDLIDPALLRPGRLDKQLYVGPCEDKDSQLSVLTALTRKLRLASDVDLQQVVSSLPSKVSGAQISALCSAAWLASARETIQSGQYKEDPTVVVNQSHFLSALGTDLG
ncbi:peroxisomal ATPase PEX6 [Macrosteles quadrilineatus]|uniref:peroxisomal ATPase PEX6 n=1 Tax=Macrosteles quadrilineatus TaxID=74068 RepID=UPI0023E30C9C|nr:peroxisomal ATPase PEX6 [Macrosteles quadrilineatus]